MLVAEARVFSLGMTPPSSTGTLACVVFATSTQNVRQLRTAHQTSVLQAYCVVRYIYIAPRPASERAPAAHKSTQRRVAVLLKQKGAGGDSGPFGISPDPEDQVRRLSS